MGATEVGRTLVETGTPGWYEDPEIPGKKTRKKEGDKVLSRSESQKLGAKAISSRKSDKSAVTQSLPTGKLTKHPTVEIKCVDCGETRKVQVQDKHQVKRCITHQRQHRNKRRRERRLEKSKKG